MSDVIYVFSTSWRAWLGVSKSTKECRCGTRLPRYPESGLRVGQSFSLLVDSERRDFSSQLRRSSRRLMGSPVPTSTSSLLSPNTETGSTGSQLTLEVCFPLCFGGSINSAFSSDETRLHERDSTDRVFPGKPASRKVVPAGLSATLPLHA